MSDMVKWNNSSLIELFDKNDIKAKVEADAIIVSVDFLGDFKIIVAASNSSLFMSCRLKPIESGKEDHELNGICMRLNHQIALSYLSITGFGDGEWYTMIGELSVNSKPETVLEELNVLSANIRDFVIALEDRGNK